MIHLTKVSACFRGIQLRYKKITVNSEMEALNANMCYIKKDEGTFMMNPYHIAA